MSIYEKLDLILERLDRIERRLAPTIIHASSSKSIEAVIPCDHDFHVGSHDMVCDKCELHFPIDLYASTPWYK